MAWLTNIINSVFLLSMVIGILLIISGIIYTGVTENVDSVYWGLFISGFLTLFIGLIGCITIFILIYSRVFSLYKRLKTKLIKEGISLNLKDNISSDKEQYFGIKSMTNLIYDDTCN